MLQHLLSSADMAKVFTTIYQQWRSFFTFSQLSQASGLNKGNLSRYLRKLCSLGLLSKVEHSAVYCIDKTNITVQAIFKIITYHELDLWYAQDQYIFLKHEQFFSKQHLHQSRVEGSPFFLSIICEAEQKEEDRKHWCNHKFMPYILRDGHIDRYLRYTDLAEVTTLSEEAARNHDHSFLDDRYSQWDQDRTAFYEFTAALDRESIEQRDIKQITSTLHQYIKIYINAMSCGSINEGYRFHTIPHVVKRIQEAMTEHPRHSSSPYSIHDVMWLITAVTQPTYLNHTKLTLLGLAQEIKTSYPTLYDHIAIGTNIDVLWRIITNSFPTLAEKIQVHLDRNFHGISFARVHRRTPVEFFSTIQKLYTEEVNLDESCKTLSEQPQKNIERKQQFIAYYDFDEEIRCLIEYIELASRSHDLGSEIVITMNYRWTRFLQRLALLKNCPLEVLTAMSYDEVLLFAANLIDPNTDQILERMKYALCIQKHTRYCFYLGKDAEYYHSILLQDTNCTFSGMRWISITTGTAVGPVRMLSHIYDSRSSMPWDIIIARSVDTCDFSELKHIRWLLIEASEKSSDLLQFAQSNPHIPIIIHVNNLSTYLKNDMIIHIDGDCGRVVVLEWDMKEKESKKPISNTTPNKKPLIKGTKAFSSR